MKKLALASTLATFLLAGCSTVIVTDEPVEKNENIRNICVKEATNPRLASFAPSLVNSLQKKGFQAEIKVEDQAKSCEYILAYSITPKRDLAFRAKIKLSQNNGGTLKSLGEIGYKRRGDDTENGVVNGVQGQTDLMVNELFKNF